MGRAGLYWRTLRHLQPRQFGWLLARRLLPAPRFVSPGPVPLRDGVRGGPWLAPVAPAVGEGTVMFLNSAATLLPGAADWTARDRPKLWRYNLHYFDLLHWPAWGPSARAALVADWMAANPPVAGEGWEPYPLSLRVVNWLKYVATAGPDALPPGWQRSVADQLAWLARTLEYQLGANHLLKNGKALLFGGVFFGGAVAGGWLRTGLRILVDAAREQILPDGGHYERSPMYHGIVLEDLLDVVQLLDCNPGIAGTAELAVLRAAAGRALAFQLAIVSGDGRIPLFNDAAYGIVPEPRALMAYGRQVLGGSAAAWPPPDGPVSLPDTGYFGWRAGGDSLLVDCGPIGPDHQPGHAHCDTLSFELCLGRRRVIVDAGVHDYETGPLRHYVRSTAAHNTVQVDGAEQSEIWGAFRVGRRARPLAPGLRTLAANQWEFSGGHDGFRSLPGQVTHQRRILGAPDRWAVFDLMTGKTSGSHAFASYLHLDSALTPEIGGDGTFVVRADAGPLCRISLTCGARASIEEGYHCPGFGRLERNQVLVLRSEGRLPAEMSYLIERL